MISSTADYKAANFASVRQVKAKVELYNGSTLATAYTDTDKIISIEIQRVGEDGKFFGFGICQRLNIHLIDKERTLSISTANTLKVSLGVRLADGTVEYKGFPTFEVSEVHRDEKTNELSITAYDALYRAGNHTVEELNIEAPYTIKDFCEASSALLGVSVSGADNFLLSYPNGANFEGTETLRTALDMAAEATQTIYYMNSENVLCFKALDRAGDSVFTIDKAKYIELKTSGGRRLQTICNTTELGDSVSEGTTLIGSTQYVRDNAFWELREDSKASVATGAKARNSATLKSQKIVCGAKSISGASGTIDAVESGSFTFSATDSRGYTTTQTINKTLVEYVKLTCSMEAVAATTGGVAKLKVSGNYWNGNFGAAANTLTVQYRYKVQGNTYSSWTTATAAKSGNTYSADISISGLNYLNTYVFQVRAIDKLATANSDEQIRKTTPVFDWSKEDFNINGTLKVNSTNIFDLIYPVGAVYISINSTSPQTLFGGTWKQIQGQFLLGASSAYPAGSTGGSKDAVVVAHTHNPANQSGYYGFITSASKAFTVGDMGTQSGSGRYYPYSTSAYDVSRNTQTGSTGVSGTDKNMPPYIAVYIWYRTA